MAARLDTIAERESAGLDQFVAGYRPLPGVFDEMMDGDGGVRAHWRPFLATLAALGADEIHRRFAAADRYLRGSGAFYRVYEDAAGIERPWPLSHLPLIIEPSEWRDLAAGLVQRATLLEAVLADAYGASNLSRDGRLFRISIAPRASNAWRRSSTLFRPSSRHSAVKTIPKFVCSRPGR